MRGRHALRRGDPCRHRALPSGWFVAEKVYAGFAKNPLFQRLENKITRHAHIRPFLQNHQRIRCNPATLMGGKERLLAETLTVGRICEDKMKRLDVSNGTETGRIPPQDASTAMQAELLDVFPQKTASLNAVLDEQCAAAAARQSLQPYSAGSGKQVKNPGAIDGLRVDMADDVEQALPRPVDGRPDRV